MSNILHRIIIFTYYLIIILTIGLLAWYGKSYYSLPIELRFDHPQYDLMKPSGFFSHGLGIVGTLIMLIGLFGYMARKRLKIFSGIGVLKYWLELHIFLCTFGTVLILFHTTFKFGGIISVGFWSLLIVWISGVIGRFIYLEIPKTIEGRELSLAELQELKVDVDNELGEKYKLNFKEIKSGKFSKIRLKLISNHISKKDFNKVHKLIRKERKLERRIRRLEQMRNLFKYWHFAHLPFAMIVLILMVIHVGVALFFGYKWIF